MPDGLTLYPGTVMHTRVAKRRHMFRYRVFTVCLDLMATPSHPWFSLDRWNLLSIRAADHGPRTGAPLRPFIEALLAKAGAPPAARLLMLTYPRLLGLAFNPLTVYFALAADGALLGLVYEVRNTFGGIHHYVHVPETPAPVGQTVRHSEGKAFFVSPFIDMAQRYHFAVDAPGERVSVRIVEKSGEAVTLTARFDGTAQPMTRRTIAAALARVPLLPLTVLGGIHFEALRLVLKGIGLQKIPKDAGRPRRARHEGVIRS
ncbi:MAG: DUF1365 domain-containing protein [Pseudomonadota bacterium]